MRKESKIKPLKSAWPSTLFPRYESAGRTMVVVYLTWTLPLSRRPRKPIKAAAGKAVEEEVEAVEEEVEAVEEEVEAGGEEGEAGGEENGLAKAAAKR